MRAETASDILDSRLFKESVERLRTGLYKRFLATDDHTELAKVAAQHRALEAVLTELSLDLKNSSINLQNRKT